MQEVTYEVLFLFWLMILFGTGLITLWWFVFFPCALLVFFRLVGVSVDELSTM